MRSDLVVCSSPKSNDLSGLLQRFRPVLIQTFIAKCPVKAFNVGILSRAAGLDQDVLDTVLLRPGHEGPASEFRPVVGSHLFGVAAKRSRPVQQPGDVGPAHAKVHRDVHALAAEVICHRQAFDAP